MRISTVEELASLLYAMQQLNRQLDAITNREFAEGSAKSAQCIQTMFAFMERFWNASSDPLEIWRGSCGVLEVKKALEEQLQLLDCTIPYWKAKRDRLAALTVRIEQLGSEMQGAGVVPHEKERTACFIERVALVRELNQCAPSGLFKQQFTHLSLAFLAIRTQLIVAGKETFAMPEREAPWLAFLERHLLAFCFTAEHNWKTQIVMATQGAAWGIAPSDREQLGEKLYVFYQLVIRSLPADNLNLAALNPYFPKNEQELSAFLYWIGRLEPCTVGHAGSLAQEFLKWYSDNLSPSSSRKAGRNLLGALEQEEDKKNPGSSPRPDFDKPPSRSPRYFF